MSFLDVFFEVLQQKRFENHAFALANQESQSEHGLHCLSLGEQEVLHETSRLTSAVLLAWQIAVVPLMTSAKHATKDNSFFIF